MQSIELIHAAPMHPNEAQRIQSLQDTHLLDSEESERFKKITNLVSIVFETPIALISLVDVNRQWFLSRCGLGQKETSRDDAFCAHAIHEDEILVVENAAIHPIFKYNPLVTGDPKIRFYAGAVIRDDNNLPLGTVCIIDTKPRQFDKAEIRKLISFAKLVEQEITLPSDVSTDRMRKNLKAKLDPITSAYSGSAFFEEINRKQIMQDDAQPYYMMCLKIVNLETIRDTYGSTVAHEALLEITARLRSCVAKIGPYILGRIESKNLAVCIRTKSDFFNDQSSLDKITEQINRCLSGPIHTSVSDIEPYINFSIMQVQENESLAKDAFKLAQVCVKTLPRKAGVNSKIVTDEVKRTTSLRFELMRELEESIDNDKLTLVYQPKIEAATQEIVGAEVLLRWHHEIHGFISPLEIISIAEESNLTYKLETWVFKTAFSQVKKWQDAGLQVPIVSINVLGETLLRKGFVGVIQRSLDALNLSGENFDIEIVESSMILDFDNTIKVMNQFKEIGITFSLDDFGTGFSSLSYLRKLPITYLKIDKSFIDSIIDDQDASAMCSSIVTMAKNLGLRTVAEGVECEAQSIALNAMQCDYIQGYFFYKPLSAKDVEKELPSIDADVVDMNNSNQAKKIA